jgi:hypothetical protein
MAREIRTRAVNSGFYDNYLRKAEDFHRETDPKHLYNKT